MSHAHYQTHQVFLSQHFNVFHLMVQLLLHVTPPLSPPPLGMVPSTSHPARGVTMDKNNDPESSTHTYIHHMLKIYIYILRICKCHSLCSCIYIYETYITEPELASYHPSSGFPTDLAI